MNYKVVMIKVPFGVVLAKLFFSLTGFSRTKEIPGRPSSEPIAAETIHWRPIIIEIDFNGPNHLFTPLYSIGLLFFVFLFRLSATEAACSHIIWSHTEGTVGLLEDFLWVCSWKKYEDDIWDFIKIAWERIFLPPSAAWHNIFTTAKEYYSQIIHRRSPPRAEAILNLK